MKNNRAIPFALLALFALAACRQTAEIHRERLAEKAEPYDFFAFQRSYPDRDFDWRGWRKAIQQVRQSENTAAERSNCPSLTTNWTLQGPANVAGRVNSIVAHPGNENILLAGFAGGGLFKSADGGVNWTAVFDDQPELSIGDITYDPSDPNIVYAGTGDPNMPSITFNGNGIYKSTDGGDTWNYLALGQQGIISKVVVDPGDPDILYAATMGNPYVRDGERGVYKSDDGGLNWSKVLFVSDQAGASDLVMQPDNPQVLYASFWDRIRNNQESVIYGPHARVYKTTDGGANWTQLGGGLPTGVMGRTGLAISPQNPQKLYAIYVDSLSTVGGLYKTVDGGGAWTQVNTAAVDDAFSDFGWYFGKVRINPANDEEVYLLGVLLWRKASGGSGWQVGAGAHADTHDLIFVPSGRRYLATDGGVYRNEPNQQTWFRSKNLPATQFYRTNFNPHEPDTYWAGAQDNGVQKGNGQAINNWVSVYSADGFRCAFHPDNPDVFWVEIQNGTIHKTLDGGNSWQFGQAALGTGDRCNWDMPFFMSQHQAEKLYAGTYRVYTSLGGGGWGTISPDLTDGVIFGDRFHNISCLDESPLVFGKLLAGTSDGNVWWRQPDADWYDVSSGLPNRYVTSVAASPTLPNRIFVTHSGFRDNEEIPHVHRSDNNGQAWTDISGNLPQVPVNDLLVLPGHADSVLFAATDAGVYFSRNSGAAWSRLGGNMPIIPVFDLERNPVQNQLVAATFARGIWTFPLDSVFAQQNPVLVSLGGAIRTEADSAVALVQVAGDTTDAGGLFDTGSLPGCQSYVLKPYRNDDPLNGVSTLDLALISKHILGIAPLPSPYKIIAADANASNSVTTFDIVALRRLLLGIDTAFASNTSWRFLPSDFSFPNPLNPFTAAPFPDSILVWVQAAPVGGLNFVGFKTGDVNGSASSSLGSENDAAARGEVWPLAVREQNFKAGERVAADFFAETGATLGAQFTVYFDPSVLVFEKIEPLSAGLSAENFGANRVQAGKLSFAFENPYARTGGGATPETPLFRLVFRAKTAGALSATLRLGDHPTRAAAYRPNGEALIPALRFSEDFAPAVVGVSPNPFGASGAWLQLPVLREGLAKLQIVDNQGKMIFSKDFIADETISPHFLPAALFPTRGLYFWKIQGGGEFFSGKMIFQGK